MRISDAKLEHYGNLFERFGLRRYYTFYEFLHHPDVYWKRAVNQGDFWDGLQKIAEMAEPSEEVYSVPI